MTHAVPMDLRLARRRARAVAVVERRACAAHPARDGDLFVVPAIIGGGEP